MIQVSGAPLRLHGYCAVVSRVPLPFYGGNSESGGSQHHPVSSSSANQRVSVVPVGLPLPPIWLDSGAFCAEASFRDSAN